MLTIVRNIKTRISCRIVCSSRLFIWIWQRGRILSGGEEPFSSLWSGLWRAVMYLTQITFGSLQLRLLDQWTCLDLSPDSSCFSSTRPVAPLQQSGCHYHRCWWWTKVNVSKWKLPYVYLWLLEADMKPCVSSFFLFLIESADRSFSLSSISSCHTERRVIVNVEWVTSWD